jgi:hypothetical protein
MPLQTGKGHRFACTDYTGGKVFIVNADGNVEWEYKTGSCNDLWVLPNGNLLFNTGTGVQEVTRDKKIVFDYKGSPFKRTVKQKDGTTKQVEGPSEIYACQRLANGNTFIGECNTGRLLVVAPDGRIVKEVRLLPEGRDGGHAYIRNARLLANGNYLVTHNGEQAVREYDSPSAFPTVTRSSPVATGLAVTVCSRWMPPTRSCGKSKVTSCPASA